MDTSSRTERFVLATNSEVGACAHSSKTAFSLLYNDRVTAPFDVVETSLRHILSCKIEVSKAELIPWWDPE